MPTVGGAAGPLTLSNCGEPGVSIQNAVDTANPAKPTTIIVKGICVEAVTVAKDDITLKAHETGGMMEGSISVVGGQRVTIDGLRVTGGGKA